MESQNSGWVGIGRCFAPCRIIFQVNYIICCWPCAHQGTPEVTLNHIPQQLLHPLSGAAGPLVEIHGRKSLSVPAEKRVLSRGCFIPPAMNTWILLPHFICLEFPFFQLLLAQLDLRARPGCSSRSRCVFHRSCLPHPWPSAPHGNMESLQQPPSGSKMHS